MGHPAMPLIVVNHSRETDFLSHLLKYDRMRGAKGCNFSPGGMTERLKVHVLKTCVGLLPPGVRIPLPPPENIIFGEVPEWLNGAAC